jgi:ribosomal protein L40E
VPTVARWIRGSLPKVYRLHIPKEHIRRCYPEEPVEAETVPSPEQKFEMSVVLRCRTCATTQGNAGECEACFEGEVRYFCTNNDEGVWLDGPVCVRCGAKFGDPPRKAPTPRAPTVPTRPAGAPDSVHPGASA